MKSLVLSNFDQPWLPLVALIIFVTVFLIMLIHIFRKTSGENYKNIQNLPFDEGVKND